MGVSSWLKNKDKTTTENTTPWYQDFNPFGTGNTTTTTNEPSSTTNPDNTIEETPSTFGLHQITDFAVAGATFLEDTRPIPKNNGEVAATPEPVKTIIDAKTKEGRKEIQTILNTTLSLKPALTADGNFGKKTIEAIKNFQKLNNIPTTGLIDDKTAPYFTKLVDPSTLPKENQFEKAPSLRFVERVTGHIYKMFLDTKVKEKISNSTIPSVYQAFFNNKGDSVIYRYVSTNGTITSFIATLGASKGEFLVQDISDFSVSKDKTKFFYITENSSGTIGTIGEFGATKRNNVFSSPFTEWLSEWDGNQKIYLTTKPSYTATGSMFSLNTTNKTISKILGGVLGLTTSISPKGSLVLYSTSTETGPRLSVFDISKHTTKDLNTYGLPEKCVWSNDNINVYCAIPSVIIGNQYPDLWYQGLVSFDDYFVKINTQTGDKSTLSNKGEKSLDGTYLFLDTEERSLFFINKKDSTLWSLDLR